jgi:hypothetical protein
VHLHGIAFVERTGVGGSWLDATLNIDQCQYR